MVWELSYLYQEKKGNVHKGRLPVDLEAPAHAVEGEKFCYTSFRAGVFYRRHYTGLERHFDAVKLSVT